MLMKMIADLHIHSRFSMATSKEGTPENLDFWARKKGISLIGTGDFTHPVWREELKERVTEETFPQDEEPYEEMLADFAQAVLEKRPVRVNGLEGLNSLELTNAAYLSAWMGAPVSLPIDEVQYERELEKRIREEI